MSLISTAVTWVPHWRLHSACMKAHGYDWTLTDKRCHVTGTVERNPYCYTPNDPLDRLLYLIEQPEPLN